MAEALGPMLVTPRGYEVPRQIRANLEYRAALLRHARDDPDAQAAFNRMAASDIIWWLASFCWTYDPRAMPPLPRKIPFVPYPFQVDYILGTQEAILQGRDEATEKTREMGVTWSVLYVLDHFFLFVPDMSFLAVSRNEDCVDKTDNPKALLWKLDFNHRELPVWMCPPDVLVRPNRTFCHMRNPWTRTVIDGEATTENIGVSDRRTAIFVDEFPAISQGQEILDVTADVTSCRLIVGTARKRADAFHRWVTSGQVKRRRVFFTDHPIKARGLYRFEGGKVEMLDGYQGKAVLRTTDGARVVNFPDDWPFMPTGQLGSGVYLPFRSIWLDNEYRRRGSNKALTREILIEYDRPGLGFFDEPDLDRHIERFGCEPSHVGSIRYRHLPGDKAVEMLGWAEDFAESPWRLWFHPDEAGSPPYGNYAIGADVAFGQSDEGSNSTLSVWSVETQEKVAEFASRRYSPEEFACIARAAQVWFAGSSGEAYLMWEAPGPGHTFGRTVMGFGAWNVYYHQDEASQSPERSKKPGWFPVGDAKELVLGEYRRALNLGELTNHSVPSLEEAKLYVYSETGALICETAADLATGAQKAHGDRVVADALGFWACKLQPRAPRRASPLADYASRRKAWLRTHNLDHRWAD